MSAHHFFLDEQVIASIAEQPFALGLSPDDVRHAKVLRLDYHHHSQWIKRLLNTILYLQRQSLLHLKALGKNIHHAGNLAQACNISVWDICHMNLAEERQNMMFAEGVKINILHNDHLTVILLEHGTSQYGMRILGIA
jgi:hypothetical protein